MTSLKTSIKTITYLSDIGCLEIQGASLLATLTWVDWYNNRRLLERLGHIPPAEAEKAYYASIGNDDLAA
ncbi:hypothetical protein AC44_2418 [Escherichia coli 2-177-06_S3_C3]|nr:hypothetical protein AC44_2418 [Escherichia coli 2-177-06_S3_C3]